MVSQDVEDNLSRRFMRWAMIAAFSLMIVLGFVFVFNSKQSNLQLTLFVIFILIAFVAFLITFFNMFVWLKVRSAIRAYHRGNYDKAKDIAIAAYKLSNYPEINDLIDYIDSQIIDEIVTQQERLEKDQSEHSEFYQDVSDLIEDIELRIKRLNKIKAEIQQKLNELNTEQNKDQQFFHLINQYTDLLRFTEYKIDTYADLLNKLNVLKNRYLERDKLLRQQEDLRDLQEKILTEAYMASDDDDEDQQEEPQEIRNEDVFLEYVKEFLASTMSVDKPEEFQRIYNEFRERMDDLALDFTSRT